MRIHYSIILEIIPQHKDFLRDPMYSTYLEFKKLPAVLDEADQLTSLITQRDSENSNDYYDYSLPKSSSTENNNDNHNNNNDNANMSLYPCLSSQQPNNNLIVRFLPHNRHQILQHKKMLIPS
ncbi:4363_t:CDS:2 [Ambispora gerdemannii]|uniref:4363_t:CDS:1 n=1 Tax=Ambispora gerdemannii TaxID=144530 RepID=A0A9N8VLK4_9GLOM|nr:4363_t:CDS:2 [Ambispora gerdemannii]